MRTRSSPALVRLGRRLLYRPSAGDGLHKACRDVVHVPRYGDARGDRIRAAESLDVGCDRGGGIDDRAVAERQIVSADPLGVGAAEGVVGEGAGSALGVV